MTDPAPDHDLSSMVINIRSDTQTLPTAAMREAVFNAELGDDTYDMDPTVQRFETLAAEKTGMESALLVLSGTMGNLTALMTHARPGDELVVDTTSHLYNNEAGNLASVAGLMPRCITSRDGMIDPDELASIIRGPNLHYPRPRLLCLENTHNSSGGRVVPVDLFERLCAIAHEHDMAVHLDGARIFNAAVATGQPVSAWTRHADSIQFCLSKGLGAPLGSALCGSREFIEKADRCRKRLGGGMRQAGVMAAAGIVALETMVDRLAEDHANASYLAQKLDGLPGLSINLDHVETNMVYVDHAATGLSTSELAGKLAEAGVEVSTRPPHEIRLVPTYHHDRAMLDEVVRRFAEILT